tara:strand:+ start:2236 stop:2685 length:450 start_codon:yes stop_codon:yes gene_type:complete
MRLKVKHNLTIFVGMDIRLLKEEDYDNTLVKWWKTWRWTPPIKDLLPDNGKGGIMVSKDGVDICAGFLFLTNSKTAWCEYIISNFEYKEDDRPEAIEFLINTLSHMAKDKGYAYVYVSLKNNPLIDRYTNCGYIKGSTNCTEMIKILNK